MNSGHSLQTFNSSYEYIGINQELLDMVMPKPMREVNERESRFEIVDMFEIVDIYH